MTNLLLQDRPTGVNESTWPSPYGSPTISPMWSVESQPETRPAGPSFGWRPISRAGGENSWVRIPRVRLGPFARRVLLSDPKADKTLPDGPDRSDAGRFFCQVDGQRRLACISFGCCYGKPLDQLGPAARRFFEHFHFAFTGEMKKIAYSSGLDGAKVVPVQALSALVLVLSGLVGSFLFLNSRYGAAVLVTALVSQLWRAYSEGLRADYRGDHRVSAYRIPSLAAAACAAGMLMVLPGSPQIRSQLNLGLELLWDPKVLLLLQALWLFVFFRLGRSMVTRSTLVMSVRKDRV